MLGLAPGAILTLSGCFATDKHVEMIETDITERAAWTDERFERMESDLESVGAENEALRQRMDDLSDQITALGGDVSARLAELTRSDEDVAAQALRAARSADDVDARRERDRAEFLEKMNAVLEEVLAENERLASRVEALENSALTFGRVHKVAAGESVASIAAKYGVTVEAIVDANGLSNASLIRVGQELVVPGTK